VKKSFSKYFVVSLSLLLILSNFSYATHLMLCAMSDDATVCECSHNDGNLPDELSYKKEKSGCCTSEISELTNSNLLTTVKFELPNNINSFSALILDLNRNSELYAGSFLNSAIDKSHLPKLDIPILTSSLLI
jgi:hypothetical protein